MPDGPPVQSIRPPSACRRASRTRGSRAPCNGRAAAPSPAESTAAHASDTTRPARTPAMRRPAELHAADRRHVAAGRHEGGVAEADLPAVAHQHVEAEQRDEKDPGDHERAEQSRRADRVEQQRREQHECEGDGSQDDRTASRLTCPMTCSGCERASRTSSRRRMRPAMMPLGRKINIASSRTSANVVENNDEMYPASDLLDQPEPEPADERAEERRDAADRDRDEPDGRENAAAVELQRDDRADHHAGDRRRCPPRRRRNRSSCAGTLMPISAAAEGFSDTRAGLCRAASSAARTTARERSGAVAPASHGVCVGKRHAEDLVGPRSRRTARAGRAGCPSTARSRLRRASSMPAVRMTMPPGGNLRSAGSRIAPTEQRADRRP